MTEYNEQLTEQEVENLIGETKEETVENISKMVVSDINKGTQMEVDAIFREMKNAHDHADYPEIPEYFVANFLVPYLVGQEPTYKDENNNEVKFTLGHWIRLVGSDKSPAWAVSNTGERLFLVPPVTNVNRVVRAEFDNKSSTIRNKSSFASEVAKVRPADGAKMFNQVLDSVLPHDSKEHKDEDAWTLAKVLAYYGYDVINPQSNDETKQESSNDTGPVSLNDMVQGFD